MSIDIFALNEYDRLNLNNNKFFKMPSGMLSFGPEECTIYFYPEGATLEEVEAIFQDVNNTKRIQTTDLEGHSVYNTLDNYTIVSNIRKLYHEIVYKYYDEAGVYHEKYSDIFSVSLRKPTADDAIPKIQATMEYMAIMTDVDIDEEI